MVLPGDDGAGAAGEEADKYAARLSTLLPGVANVESATGRYADGQPSPATGQQAEALSARYTSAAGTWVAVTPSAADPADARSVVRDIREEPRRGRCWSVAPRPPWSMPPTPSPTGCRGL